MFRPDVSRPNVSLVSGKVVVASRNRHKIIEIGALLDHRGFTLVPIDELSPTAVLREDESTFEGNALAKARQASAATGLPALADDSGLEVDALHGEPGVWSARYAGLPTDDERNNDKLLAALEGVPVEARHARYRCVAAFVDGKGGEIWRAGACEGIILQSRQGTGGFGYDPLFLIPSLGLTMAQIDLEKKNSLSHRAAAFRALASALFD